MLKEFPRPLATVAGEAIGLYYYNHRLIESVFYEAGASGDVPEGNCIAKVTEWLSREGKRNPTNAVRILGKVIEELMDGDNPRSSLDIEKDKERLKEALTRYGLEYCFGGHIYVTAMKAPSHALGKKLKEVSIAEIDVEFDRAYRSIETDPPAAVTAACAILEALCKEYIAANGLDMPSNQSIKQLWTVVSKHLRVAPDNVEDNDLKRILSGLTSIVDGIGSY